MNFREQRVFRICILCSLCLHALFIFFLHHHVIYKHVINVSKSFFENQNACLTPLAKDLILQDAFDDFATKPSSTLALPKKTEENFSLSLKALPLLCPSQELESLQPTTPFQIESLLVSNMCTPNMKTPQQQRDLALRIKAPQAIPLPPQANPCSLELPKGIQATPSYLSSFTPKALLPFKNSLQMNHHLMRPHLDIKVDEPSISPSTNFPCSFLPNFPSLEELQTATYSDFFDLEILCLPCRSGSGYDFAITLIPHEDLDLPRLQQTYTFLIDRSNSIQKDRLLVTKEAVFKALDEIDEEDFFNILVFDSRTEKLFPTPKQRNVATLSQAKAFLEKVQLGSFFSPAELYTPLFLSLPSHEQNDDVYTAILLTDGEALAKKSNLRSILHTWTEQNFGRVSLFTLSMNEDSQTNHLELASIFNKGKLITSPTKRGLKRKLTKIMKITKDPVIKNISCKTISTSSQHHVELFPKTYEISHFYLHQPLVILGKTDSLNDFVLFIQGRMKDQWINIKKTVSFANAKRGTYALHKELALQQSYECYKHYLKDENSDHITHAQELLLPFDLGAAF